MTQPFTRPIVVQPERHFIWGIPGTGEPNYTRDANRKVFHVDYTNGNDSNYGTDPTAPIKTLSGLVARTWEPHLDHYDIVYVYGALQDSVETLDYVLGPNYVSIIGVGPSRYGAMWDSGGDALVALDLQAVGWRIENFRFMGRPTAACIQLRHTDTAANDIAIRTIIKDCYFDGQTTGRYGIVSHGCYDVWVTGCTFSLWHNAVAGGAIAMNVGTTPLAIPYRNMIENNRFYDNDNHCVWPSNGSLFVGNTFQNVGYAYATTLSLQTSVIANPGDDNQVMQNYFGGDYSIAGGYRGGAADEWFGNFTPDIAEAEVADNGLTILPPA